MITVRAVARKMRSPKLADSVSKSSSSVENASGVKSDWSCAELTLVDMMTLPEMATIEEKALAGTFMIELNASRSSSS